MISVGANIASSAALTVHSPMGLRVVPSSSSRILDIPCKVCGDNSSGKHYNIFACDGCAGFFKRSIRKNRQYVCKAKSEGTCIVDKTHRNQCRACRLTKCQESGMNKDAVQHERGPRNSTLRRQQQQMAHILSETAPKLIGSASGSVLDLAMAGSGPSPRFQPPLSMSPSATFFGNASVSLPRLPIGFHIPPPPSLAEIMNPKDICEAAARLLFFNVTWAKTVPSFTSLPMQDQLLLLEESWRELFILGAAQYLPPLELTPLIHAYNLTTKRESDKVAALMNEVREFQATILKVASFRVDQHEFACLRAMVLFKNCLEGRGCASPSSVGSSSTTASNENNARVLTDPARAAAIQDNTQLMLNKYVLTAYPGQPLRFGKLLLLLPALRTVSSTTIEELFFRSTIGQIPIVNIICNMYKTTPTDVL